MLGFNSIGASPIGGMRNPLQVQHLASLGAVARFGAQGTKQQVHVPSLRNLTQFGTIGARRHHSLADLLSMIQPNMSLQETPRLSSISYGDGYSSDLPDGLVALTRTLTMTWTSIDKADADLIMNFMRTNSGARVQITAPRERTPRNWIATSVRRSRPYPDGDNVSAVFSETFP